MRRRNAAMPTDGGRRRASTRMLLLADTHLGAGQGSRLLSRIGDDLGGIDVIVHAGDITDESILDALAARAPHVVAVRGNNDAGLDLPDRVQVDVEGCRVGVIHDSGSAAGRARRLRSWFPECDLVVFGHSHLPWHEIHRDVDGHVQHQVNPGSAMLRRRAPECTVARVVIRAGHITEVQHVPVGCPAPFDRGMSGYVLDHGH